MKGPPERYVDMEEVYRERFRDEADIEELKSLHSDIMDVKSNYVGILEGKINRAQTLFNHNLLLVAALVTSISFLIQGSIIEISALLDRTTFILASSLLFTSSILSMLAYIPIKWTKREFKSIYETGQKDVIEDEVELKEKIEDELTVLEELREEIKLRDLFSIGGLGSLMGCIVLLSYGVIINSFSTLQIIAFVVPFSLVSLGILYRIRHFFGDSSE